MYVLDTKRRWGIGLIIIGVILIIIGVVIHFVIPQQLANAVAQGRVIQTPLESNSSYNSFVNPTNPTPTYNGFFLFNIDNADVFFSTGAAPHFSQKGPYVYQTTSIKVNVTFSADSTQVTYKSFTTPVFNATLSTGSLSDNITMANPVYQAILKAADGSEDYLLAGFMIDTYKNLTATFLGQVQSFQPQIEAMRCSQKNGIPYVFNQVKQQFIAGQATQLGEIVNPVNNPNSFSALFTSGAMALVYKNIISQTLSTTPSPLLSIPIIYMDDFAASFLGAAVLQFQIGHGDPYGLVGILSQFTLNDNRLLTCNWNSTGYISEQNTLCAYRTALGLTASSASPALTGLTFNQTQTVATLYSQAAASIVSTYNLPFFDALGPLQWNAAAVLNQPLTVATSGGSPLEIVYVTTPFNTTQDAYNAMLSIWTLLAGGSSTAVLSGLPPAYSSYLQTWMAINLGIPHFLDTIFAASNSNHTVAMDSLQRIDKRVTAYFLNAQVTGSVQIIQAGTSVTYIISLSNTAGGSNHKLLLQRAASTGLCPTSLSGFVDLTSVLNISINFTNGKYSNTVVSNTTIFDITTPYNLLSDGYVLALTQSNGNDSFSNGGACSNLLQPSDANFYYDLFNSNNLNSLVTPTGVNQLQYPSMSNNIANFVRYWLQTYFISNSTAAVSYFETVYISLFDSIMSSYSFLDNFALLAKLPPVNSKAPFFTAYYEELFPIQIGLGFLFGNESIVVQPGVPSSIANLPYYPEIPIESTSPRFGYAVPGGYSTANTTLSYSAAKAVISIVANATIATEFFANPTAFFTANNFSASQQTIAYEFLRYAIDLSEAAAWKAGFFSTVLPTSQQNAFTVPPNYVQVALYTPVHSLMFLDGAVNSTVCEGYMTYNQAAFPYTVPNTTYTDVFIPYFQDLELTWYNLARVQYGVPVTNVTYGNLDDFFYLQFGTSFLSQISPQTPTFKAMAQALALSEPNTATGQAAQELVNALGNAQIEFWAAAYYGPFSTDPTVVAWEPLSGVPFTVFSKSVSISLDYYSAKELLSVLTSDATTFNNFALAFLTDNSAAIRKLGYPHLAALNTAYHNAVVNYISYSISVVSSRIFFSKFEGSTLIVTRTAQEWLEGMTDPLLAATNPSDDVFGYYIFPTLSSVLADPHVGPTYYTRGSNVSLLAAYNGEPTTTSWKMVQSIDGTSDGTSLPPNFQNNAFNAYVPEIDRVFSFSYINQTTIKNINLARFVFDVSNLNTNIDILIQGELELGNMSGFYNGSSLFATLPMFCGVNLTAETAYAPVNLAGLQQNCYPDSYDHWTYSDIDRVTGLAFNGMQQLQLNTRLHKSAVRFSLPKMQNDYIAPLYYEQIYSTISDADAAAYQKEIVSAEKLASLGLIIFVAIGAALLLLGLVLMLLPVKDDGLDMAESELQLTSKGTIVA